eukprot:PhM_4_TR7738/c0_g1_i1/m.37853/K06269/PPP1C; serine/threonine-protein phosphatase PP1 catalytic subunit
MTTTTPTTTAADTITLFSDILHRQLLSVKSGGRTGRPIHLREQDIRAIVLKSREVFLSQPALLEVRSPIKVCGDVHGQYYDLLRLFDATKTSPPSALSSSSSKSESLLCDDHDDGAYANKGNQNLNNNNNYLFLGDYVDRGKNSIETICLILVYKVLFPESFFVLRGNHESASINRIYGFYDDCKRRYSIKLWKLFTDTFNCMPLAALIESKIFCMHGGLSPELLDLQNVRDILRPVEVPEHGLLCDLLWSDPDEEQVGWGENDRGVSHTFGDDVISGFLRQHNLDLIVRAHQVVEEGYQFFNEKRELVTVFSAPNYCGEFDNAAAVLCVGQDLMCSFVVLKSQVRPPAYK